MPTGATLRIDECPIEDFLTSLDQHEKDVRPGYLPRPVFLKEVKLEGLWSPPELQGEEERLTVYLLQETDAISQRTEAFVLLHGASGTASALRALALRWKSALDRVRIPSLFRIDPKYGLVYGSALEPVDTTLKWDRPGIYVTLYVATTASSPSIALLEYVPMDDRARYTEIFQKYNRVPPEKPSLLKNTWKILKRKTAEPQASRRLDYKFVRHSVKGLQREPIKEVKISMIYKDLDPSDAQKILLDPGYVLYAPSGQDRFFASLGELA